MSNLLRALVFTGTGTAKGEIVGNDEIHFKRELMGFPAEEFVAKRSK